MAMLPQYRLSFVSCPLILLTAFGLSAGYHTALANQPVSYTNINQTIDYINTAITAYNELDSTAQREKNARTIADALQTLPQATLQQLADDNADPISSAWANLTLVSQMRGNFITWLSALANWQANNPTHPANQFLPKLSLIHISEPTRPY